MPMQEKIDRTGTISTTLFDKLVSQGLTRVEITRLIKDVFNLVGDGGYFTVESVNENLEHLGWKNELLSEVTLDLILFMLENEYDYEVEKHTVH